MPPLAKAILIFAGIALAVFFVLVGLAFYLMRDADITTLRWLAAVFVVCWLFTIPTVGFMGFYFGKTESRGALRGIDATVERMFDPLVRAVEIRENVRQSIKNNYGQPAPTSLYPADLMQQLIEQQNRQYLPPARGARSAPAEPSEPNYPEDDNGGQVIKF